MVVDCPTDFNFFRRGGVYVFPLFLAPESGQVELLENLASGFRAYLDGRYEHHRTAEEVLGYCYAILRATDYHTRYAEFLRADFPRVPFHDSSEDFESLSILGWSLVQAHLLREFPRRGLAKYHGSSDHTVDAVRYAPGETAVWINSSQYFAPVPVDVWGFHIGGYQVIEKYLKARKGRKLSLDEINHVGAVADSLAFSIETMGEIDTAYRAAFPDQA